MTKWPRKRRMAAGMGAAALLLAIYGFWIEPYWIQVTSHEVGSGSREMVILHLTDLHFSTPGRRERRVLEIQEAFKPDLIVITGDSIVRNYDQRTFTEFMSKLRAPLGTYACLGNWEAWVGGPIDQFYRRAGVRLLDDVTLPLETVPVDISGFSS